MNRKRRYAKEEFAQRGNKIYQESVRPVVEDGKVILPVGGRGASVVALDERDGATVWSAGHDPASYASVLPISFEGRRT